MKSILSLTFLLVPLTILLAEESVSNAELSRKLDLILGKVGGLEERVGKLESENKAVNKEVKQVAQSAAEAKTATENLQIPNDEKEKASFFKKLKNQIYSQEALDSGPWAKKENWEIVQESNSLKIKIDTVEGEKKEGEQ